MCMHCCQSCVLHGSATCRYVQCAFPGILAALSDKSSSASSLKIEALQFLRSAMEANDPAVFIPHLPKLMPAVVGAASERYYKVLSAHVQLHTTELKAHVQVYDSYT